MKISIFSAVMLGILHSTAASETIEWKNIGGWAVRMDPTMGNACYVMNVYEDGTILRLGFNFLDGNRGLYFSLGNEKWKSLEHSKDYPVVIIFDGNPPWDATAVALSVNGINHLVVNTNDSNFANEFSRKLSVRAYYADKQIAALRLKGSAKAIDEMIDCQKTTSQYFTRKPSAPNNTDPFAPNTSVKASDDPFAL